MRELSIISSWLESEDLKEVSYSLSASRLSEKRGSLIKCNLLIVIVSRCRHRVSLSRFLCRYLLRKMESLLKRNPRKGDSPRDKHRSLSLAPGSVVISHLISISGGTSRTAFFRLVGSTKPLLRLRLETIASLKHSRSFSSMFFEASRSTLKRKHFCKINRVNNIALNLSLTFLPARISPSWLFANRHVFFIALQFWGIACPPRVSSACHYDDEYDTTSPARPMSVHHAPLFTEIINIYRVRSHSLLFDFPCLPFQNVFLPR